MNDSIDQNALYRLPWNLADNSISWLEPTSKCNMYCDGCYRENRMASHKTLDEIRAELDIFRQKRKTDSISIAGGEPLLHPDIVEIVRIIKSNGWKPVINTNGELLSPGLLSELKAAGAFGFTFHIDSGQNRPGWKDKNELELNELRLKYAKMLDECGGLSCSFNMTVYPENMEYIPELLKWAQDNISIVNVMVFIIYRIAVRNDYDYMVGSSHIQLDDITYSRVQESRRTDVSSLEVLGLIRQSEPDFSPCAFLNGTIVPDSYKWLLTGRLGNKNQIFGYTGAKFMELVQTFKHWFTGSYLAYANPKMNNRGLLYLVLSFIDEGLRKTLRNYLKSFIKNPGTFFGRIYFQSVMIIQPVDILENGNMNMCDGCPDITVHDNKLVWSCRMEELLKYDNWMRAIPKN